MSDNREEGFIKYNKDNIFMNLLQVEQHLRDINPNDLKGGHAQCCNKHLFLIQGELDEAISHSQSVEPSNMGTYKELKSIVVEFRKGLTKRSISKNIEFVRTIRKVVETLDPEEFDTKECRACGPIFSVDAEPKKTSLPTMRALPATTKEPTIDGHYKALAAQVERDLTTMEIQDKELPPLPEQTIPPKDNTIVIPPPLPFLPPLVLPRLGDANDKE